MKYPLITLLIVFFCSSCGKISTTFHSNGNIKSKGEEQNGNKVGKWTYFCENGSKDIVVWHSRKEKKPDDNSEIKPDTIGEIEFEDFNPQKSYFENDSGVGESISASISSIVKVKLFDLSNQKDGELIRISKPQDITSEILTRLSKYE